MLEVDGTRACRILTDRPARRALQCFLRKSSWQDLQICAVGPNAALSASGLPVFAASSSLAVASCSFCASALNLSCCDQTSGFAPVSPLSLPSTKAPQGSLASVATSSALALAAAAS